MSKRTNELIYVDVSMSSPNNYSESKPILQARNKETNEVKRTQKTDFQSIC